MAQWLNSVSEAEGEPVPPTTPIYLAVGGVLIIWVGTLSSLAPILFPIWPLPPSPSPSDFRPPIPATSVIRSLPLPLSLSLPNCQLFSTQLFLPLFFATAPLVRETEHVISTLISGLPTSHGLCSVRVTAEGQTAHRGGGLQPSSGKGGLSISIFCLLVFFCQAVFSCWQKCRASSLILFFLFLFPLPP